MHGPRVMSTSCPNQLNTKRPYRMSVLLSSPCRLLLYGACAPTCDRLPASPRCAESVVDLTLENYRFELRQKLAWTMAAVHDGVSHMVQMIDLFVARISIAVPHSHERPPPCLGHNYGSRALLALYLYSGRELMVLLPNLYGH